MTSAGFGWDTRYFVSADAAFTAPIPVTTRGNPDDRICAVSSSVAPIRRTSDIVVGRGDRVRTRDALDDDRETEEGDGGRREEADVDADADERDRRFAHRRAFDNSH